MERELHFSDLFSHIEPKKYLEVHLYNVAKMAEGIIDEKIINIPDEEKNIVKKVTLLCGFCHDLGKATDYFQNYLLADEKAKNKLKNLKETRHGLLSAMVAYFAVKEELKDEGEKFFPFVSYLAVKKHHGDLKDVMEEVVITEKELEVLKKQINSIDEKKFNVLIKNLMEYGFKIGLTKELMMKWLELLPRELRTVKRNLRNIKEDDLYPYFLVNLIYSALIDADKTEVVMGERHERPKINLSEENVILFKKIMNYKKSFINDLREEAFKDVISKELDLNKKIYTVNLPTGMGKTLTSVAFAFKLRRKFYEKFNKMPGIIYALPFLSIIEQNAKVIEDVLSKNGFAVYSDVVLKHHHLSEISYKTEEEELTGDRAEFLIEGWDSEIVVTTFVQLFNAMISNKNSSLRRFNKLMNSIIILDEIQAIPVKYLRLIERLVKELIEKFNSYIIISTATYPVIFNDSAVELSESKFFKLLDRVNLNLSIKEKIKLEDFLDSLNFEGEKSYLFILNTIKSAREFYYLLKQKLGEEDIIYLSTHVAPKERLERIENLKDKKARFAVTTQLVEAGVDIDFDVVFRDFAPLDSLVQSAGRCNRNNFKKGEVNVVCLCEKNDRLYATYIYDRILLEITKDVLINYENITESQFYEIIGEYFRQVSKRKSFNESEEILKAVSLLNYDSSEDAYSISHFKLIEEDIPKFEVFIELDEEAQRVWQQYIELKKIKDIFERRERFKRFRADFYKYVISVPVYTKNIPPVIEGFGYVSKNSLNEYYDKFTGFRCEGELSIW